MNDAEEDRGCPAGENAFALATVAGAALADSNCTGPKAERPASCHESGQAGPGNFVSDGGGALAPNH